MCTGTVQGVLLQCSMYWSSAKGTELVQIKVTVTVQTVLVRFRVYLYITGCTGAKKSILVQCRVYWYTAECTGSLQSALLQCIVNWYSARRTGAV